MGSPNREEFVAMLEVAKDCNYVLETGSGASTIAFANNGTKVISIDIVGVPDELTSDSPNATYLTGWSVRYEDIIKVGHKFFNKSRYKGVVDEGPAFCTGQLTGTIDLIRKVIQEHGVPQFFFCDTGEYCGIAEWNIMSKLIPVGGYIAMHDIHYPKSVKNFLPYGWAMESCDWELLYKSNSIQGLCIFRKLL